MLKLLHSQIDNERAIYENLRATGRNDVIARLVLERIQREISCLQRKIDEKETGQKVVEHRHSSGLIRHAQEAMRRYWVNCNEYYHTIFRIPAKEALQASAGVK